MRRIIFILLFILNVKVYAVVPTIIKFPEPDLNGKFSLEQAIKNRRSIRQFKSEALKTNQIGQLCWAAQGITDPNKNFRAAPSAGALYPVKLYVALPDGLYIYLPDKHLIEKQIDGDIRPMLWTASFRQKAVREAPCIFIITGRPQLLEIKYRNRGDRFTWLEAGHIAQNIHLQAVTLGLGSVPIGVFDAKAVAGLCRLPQNDEVIYLIPVGIPSATSVLEPADIYDESTNQQQVDLHTKRVAIIVPSKFFNDMEFFSVDNTLQLAGVRSVIASSTKKEIKGLDRNTLQPALLVKDLKVDDFDAFVFIGGPGTKEFFDSNDVLQLVRLANEKGKILAAINNAPVIFSNAGIVKGKKIASSQRKRIIAAGGIWVDSTIEVDGNIITSSGSDTARLTPASSDVAQRFATTIVRLLREQPR